METFYLPLLYFNLCAHVFASTNKAEALYSHEFTSFVQVSVKLRSDMFCTHTRTQKINHSELIHMYTLHNLVRLVSRAQASITRNFLMSCTVLIVYCTGLVVIHWKATSQQCGLSTLSHLGIDLVSADFLPYFLDLLITYIPYYICVFILLASCSADATVRIWKVYHPGNQEGMHVCLFKLFSVCVSSLFKIVFVCTYKFKTVGI